MKVAPITKGGQISVPAAVRKRWGTRRVLIDDQGDHLVVKPLPDDPIEAVAGIFAGRGRHTVDELRAIGREEERRIEERRSRGR
ncbi:MAG TPA: AbrB/MazE/SpoVT family DNA-binding domain-containing protein [Gaiellaceae bacterium]|nr:AbrB/MazE/SpoVT family DNA-binding domain-containing protein [Gaiellaceae bacterium]